jgi:trimeric autotransporter adhesin
MKNQLFFFFLTMIAASANAQNIWSVNGGFSSTGTTDLMLQTNGTTRVTVSNASGFVGIGTTPTELLDVNGIMKLRNLGMNNALQRLLVSDADGRVFWRDVNSLDNGTPSLLPFIISNTTSLGIGSSALTSNSSGNYNTALGYWSFYSNTTGSWNTASGNESLASNSTGNSNSAFGAGALKFNTTGANNTSIGGNSLYFNTTGIQNTAAGASSLSSNTTGNYNTAAGINTLAYNSTGSSNTAIGYAAGPLINNLNNTTAIGTDARPMASDQVRIGNTSVVSIGGQVSWTTLSDGRFKRDVREDVSGLAFVTQLRPVSYSLDQGKIDSFTGTTREEKEARVRSVMPRQTGFIAQEVEALIRESGYVFHGVEKPQNENDTYSIRYAEFVVPLVKAVQELNAKLIEQQKTIDALTAGIAVKGLVTGTDFERTELFQNTPNPSSMDTEIRMTIPGKVNNAALYIYDINGNQIQTRIITGRGSVVTKVDGNSLGAGIYLYALATDNHVTEAKRMILTK